VAGGRPSFRLPDQKNTVKELITLERFEIDSDSFFSLMVQFCLVRAISPIGKGDSKTQEPLRMVGYRVGGIIYYVVTDRLDLTAEEIAAVYKLRWEIEKFFAWWKKRLNVYHLISRSTYGVMVQIFAGLVTYLLMAIYCAEEYGERVNMKRVRELRNTIQNELRASQMRQIKSTKRKKIKGVLASSGYPTKIIPRLCIYSQGNDFKHKKSCSIFLKKKG
jgi:hypothetical protein